LKNLLQRKRRPENMVNNLLNFDECIQLLIEKKIENNVIIHSQMVERLARRIGEVITENNGTPQKVNFDILRMGALLHDIGRSKSHGIQHVVEGVKIAKKMNFPPEVAHIIEMHVGSGLSPGEAVELGLPEKRYFPESLEAKVVSYADNVIRGDRRVSLQVSLNIFRGKGLHEAAEGIEEAHRYLSELCGQNIDHIRM